MSHHQTAGQKHNLMIANKSFEYVVKFKHLGTKIKDQNLIHKEIKSRLNSGNICPIQFRFFWLPISSPKPCRLKFIKV
jgi:hypothetical protein